MRNLLLSILKAGVVTQGELFPELPSTAAGLPMVSEAPCEGTACRRCVEVWWFEDTAIMKLHEPDAKQEE